MFSQVCVCSHAVVISGPVSFPGGGISGIRSLTGVVIHLGDGYVQGGGYSPLPPPIHGILLECFLVKHEIFLSEF